MEERLEDQSISSEACKSKWHCCKVKDHIYLFMGLTSPPDGLKPASQSCPKYPPGRQHNIFLRRMIFQGNLQGRETLPRQSGRPLFFPSRNPKMFPTAKVAIWRVFVCPSEKERDLCCLDRSVGRPTSKMSLNVSCYKGAILIEFWPWNWTTSRSIKLPPNTIFNVERIKNSSGSQKRTSWTYLRVLFPLDMVMGHRRSSKKGKKQTGLDGWQNW